MKSYICASCGETIRVGHPIPLFRRQALTLARETTSWIARLFRRASIVRRYLDAIEDKYYAEPGRHRDLPGRCPSCRYKGQDDLPWWRAGAHWD